MTRKMGGKRARAKDLRRVRSQAGEYASYQKNANKVYCQYYHRLARSIGKYAVNHNVTINKVDTLFQLLPELKKMTRRKSARLLHVSRMLDFITRLKRIAYRDTFCIEALDFLSYRSNELQRAIFHRESGRGRPKPSDMILKDLQNFAKELAASEGLPFNRPEAVRRQVKKVKLTEANQQLRSGQNAVIVAQKMVRKGLDTLLRARRAEGELRQTRLIGAPMFASAHSLINDVLTVNDVAVSKPKSKQRTK